jgi:hypothetical protein
MKKVEFAEIYNKLLTMPKDGPQDPFIDRIYMSHARKTACASMGWIWQEYQTEFGNRYDAKFVDGVTPLPMDENDEGFE